MLTSTLSLFGALPARIITSSKSDHTHAEIHQLAVAPVTLALSLMFAGDAGSTEPAIDA
jgi:hypothetical protein